MPWLRARLAPMLGALLACLVTGLVIWLSGQALGPYLYACLLCLTGLGLWLLADWLRFRRHRLALRRVRRGLPGSLDHLPPVKGPLIGEYEALLFGLSGQLREQRTQSDARYQALMHYQALWNHQVKTPIAAMRLLLRREDSAQGRQLLGELNKVEQYVDMALHYVRLDDRASDFVFARAPLRQIAGAAARRHAAQFVLKRLELSIDIPEGLSVLTDAKWLEFVLGQLISNAVKYTKAGGVRLGYDESRRELSVQDSGPGIPAEDLPRVFDLGYTGYSGRVFQQSTGIGLYLCRQACAKLGIELRLVSSPGEGTRAVLRLPDEALEVE